MDKKITKLEEFKEKLKQLEVDFKRNKNKLIVELAMAQSPLEIGDIAEAYGGTKLKIEKITASISNDNVPYCVYRGPLLRKDGQPKKRPEESLIRQINLINPDHRGFQEK